MTLLINVGRRVPKSWFRRQANKAVGLITFQENLWQIISQSLNLAKKKAKRSGKLKFILEKEYEEEDLHYKLEWIRIRIQGTEVQEEEEYNDTMKFYEPLGGQLKKDFPKDERLAKMFNSKILTPANVKEAYEKGYGAVSDKNISNKLLEMGILLDVKWIKDFDTREVDIPIDIG